MVKKARIVIVLIIYLYVMYVWMNVMNIDVMYDV